MNQLPDLYDIQGNVCRGYGMPFARYMFLRFHDSVKSREFLRDLLPLITSSETWETCPDTGKARKPDATTNIAFTFRGLKQLGVPNASLNGFPLDFRTGMRARAEIVGDTGPNDPEHWDPLWKNEEHHAWISMNAVKPEHLEERYRKVCDIIAKAEGIVEILRGHSRNPVTDCSGYQSASAVFENGLPTSKEHFGFFDGISNPYFEGCGRDESHLPGQGKLNRDGSWSPLATGEFILGHIDEAREYPPAPMPHSLSKNGTFMVFRKLHENVAAFNASLEHMAKDFPGSKELLMAKMAGRWADDGMPLVLAPDDESREALISRMAELEADDSPRSRKELKAIKAAWSDFTFDDDMKGSKCPVGSHIRRSNPRGSLEIDKEAYNRPGALVDRRRVMRRGLPYSDGATRQDDSTEQGIIFMAICSSIERQFEFVQQQWLNYGNDFRLGNDEDPFLGRHDGHLTDKHIIQSDPEGDNPPFFCTHLPRLVETRGGDYFFIPGLTALEMIALHAIDPT